MNNVLSIVSLVVLLLAILYFGRQINVYWRIKKRMGKMLTPLTPSQSPRRVLLVTFILFVVLLISVTFGYTMSDVSLSSGFSIILAVVIFSMGRFLTKISELRERGILGQLTEIPFYTIGSYSISDEDGKCIITFKLKDGRTYLSTVTAKDKAKVVAVLKENFK